MAKTLAFYQFSKAFTTTNTFYWGSASALQAVQAVVRHFEPTDDHREKLGLMHERFDRSIGEDAAYYAAMLAEAKPWQRSATVLMVASAFERYVSIVCALASASDPLLQSGFPKILDGLLLLKRGIAAPEASVAPMVKGEWSSRLSAYEARFGSVPHELRSLEGDLEKLRIRRNSIAHEFSIEAPRDLSPHSAVILGARGAAENSQATPVGERELMNWLKAVNAAAKTIDEHLRSEFIGGFEIAALYVDWKIDPLKFEERLGVRVPVSGKGSLTKRFSAFSTGLLKTRVTHEYATGVAAYVGSL